MNFVFAQARLIFRGSGTVPDLLFWFLALAAVYLLVSFNVPPTPFGAIDEEIDYFFNAMLVSSGERPFVLLHPGTLIQNIGGMVLRLVDAPFAHHQAYANATRILPYLFLFLSVTVFYRLIAPQIGRLGAFVAIGFFLSWPGVLQYGSVFAASSFLAPMGLILIALVWKVLFTPEPAPQSYVVLAVLSGVGLSLKFVMAPFLLVLWLGLVLDHALRKGIWAGVRLAGISVPLILLGYYIAVTPFWSEAHYPYLAAIQNILLFSKSIQGNGFFAKFNHLSTDQPWLVIGYLALISSLLILALRSRGFRGLDRSQTRHHLYLFVLIIGLLAAMGPSSSAVLFKEFRLVLPFAAVPALILAYAWALGGPLLGRAKPVVALGVLAIGVASFLNNAVAHSATKEAQLELASFYSEAIATNVPVGANLGSKRIFSDDTMTVFLVSTNQNAGGFFDPEMREMYPRFSLFFPSNLPEVREFEAAAGTEFIDRLVRITCDGQSQLIEQRKGFFTHTLTFVGTRLLGERCENIVKYIVGTTFEKRGGAAAPYTDEVVIGDANGFIADVVAMHWDDDDTPTDMIMQSLDQHYGIAKFNDVVIRNRIIRFIHLRNDRE